MSYETTVISTLSKLYSYPVWEGLEIEELMTLYTQALNENWVKQYQKMSMWGTPKIDDDELEFQDMYF